MDLTNKVREALTNAKENGYTFDEMSPGEIASDLITYDSELEDEDFGEVATAVHIVRLNG